MLLKLRLVGLIVCALFISGCLEMKKPEGTPGVKAAGGITLSGEWESSGGDGVLCLGSDDTESLYTLENYETLFSDELVWWGESVDFDSKITNWTVLENKSLSRTEIINLVLDRLKIYTPVLKQKIDLAMDSISLDKWVDPETVIRDISDSTPVTELKEGCGLIQLAVRESISVPSYLPQVKVFFDKSRFEQLSTLDQAYLVLHEALYIIGKERGHKNSDKIRLLNRFLFSNQFNRIFEQNQYLSRQSVTLRAFFSHYIVDYIDLFINEDLYADIGLYQHINYQNNFTRNQSMYEINKDVRAFVDECQSDDSENTTTKSCLDELMLNRENLSFVNTDEKAFMFLLNYFFDSYGLLPGGSEHLYVIDKDDPFTHDDSIQFTLGGVCGHIEGFTEREILAGQGLPRIDGLFAPNIFIKSKIESLNHVWFSKFLYPSLLYCRDIREKLRLNVALSPDKPL